MGDFAPRNRQQSQSRGSTHDRAQTDGARETRSFLDNRPGAVAHQAMGEAIHQSARMQAQRRLQQAVDDSPRVAAIQRVADVMGAKVSRDAPAQLYAASAAGGFARRAQRAGVLQLKWIYDERCPDLIWDRPLGGLRWFCDASGRFFFKIEDDSQIDESLKKELSDHADKRKSPEMWIKTGLFSKGDWEDSDREVVPFEPSSPLKFGMN
jgi:hypothetical protein